MAVRRQLQQLFQDPQFTGSIVVERASAPAATTWMSPSASLPQPPQSSSCSMPPAAVPASPLRRQGPLPSSCSMQPAAVTASPLRRQGPLPSSSCSVQPAAVPASPLRRQGPLPSSSCSVQPAAVPSSLPRRQGPLPEECAVFHCRGCWTVLGDSLQLCGQEPPGLSILVCFKVTSDVTWEDSLLVGLEGALLGRAYYLLSCRSCGVAVGFILYSCGSDLAYLRGLFCFFKDSIICYLLKNQMIIEASKVNFPAVTLKEHLHKVKEKLVDFNGRIELVIRKLEKLEQNNYITEWQNSSADPDDLLSGYARVNAN